MKSWWAGVRGARCAVRGAECGVRGEGGPPIVLQRMTANFIKYSAPSRPWGGVDNPHTWVAYFSNPDGRAYPARLQDSPRSPRSPSSKQAPTKLQPSSNQAPTKFLPSSYQSCHQDLQSRAKRMHVPIFGHHSISCDVFSTIYIWIFNAKLASSLISNIFYRSFRWFEEFIDVLLITEEMHPFLEHSAAKVVVAFHPGVQYWYTVRPKLCVSLY